MNDGRACQVIYSETTYLPQDTCGMFPHEVFAMIARDLLGALNCELREPQCFHEGLRVLALDAKKGGVQPHIPPLLGKLPRVAHRHLLPAVNATEVGVVVELGTHAPVAAWTGDVAAPWGLLPPRSLTLVDRAGPEDFFNFIEHRATPTVHLLSRVGDEARGHLKLKLPDGSMLVDVPLPASTHRPFSVRLREVCTSIADRRGRNCAVRLWTTLLNPQGAHRVHLSALWQRSCETLYGSALALQVSSSSSRRPLRESPLSLRRAHQQVLALVLMRAISSHVERTGRAAEWAETSRVSFVRLLEVTCELWETYCLVGPAAAGELKAQIWQQYMEDVRHKAFLPERERDRSRGLKVPSAPAIASGFRGRLVSGSAAAPGDDARSTSRGV